MNHLSFFVVLILTAYSSLGQKVNIETFDTRESIKSWTIRNNGVMEHTNHFTFNGQTYYKPTKDSFLVFYDSSYNWNYSFNLSKKFKANPLGRSINFHTSIFSTDSNFQDYLSYYIQLFDKEKKNLFIMPGIQYADSDNPIVIGGSGHSFSEKMDSAWSKADSMEIIFHFNPKHPYDSFKRLIVIDQISWSNLYSSATHYSKSSFEIFPNPASNNINLIFPKNLKPNHITLLDYTGREIYQTECQIDTPQIDVKGFKSGLYFLSVEYKNGQIATQKIEVK